MTSDKATAEQVASLKEMRSWWKNGGSFPAAIDAAICALESQLPQPAQDPVVEEARVWLLDKYPDTVPTQRTTEPYAAFHRHMEAKEPHADPGTLIYRLRVMRERINGFLNMNERATLKEMFKMLREHPLPAFDEERARGIVKKACDRWEVLDDGLSSVLAMEVLKEYFTCVSPASSDVRVSSSSTPSTSSPSSGHSAGGTTGETPPIASAPCPVVFRGYEFPPVVSETWLGPRNRVASPEPSSDVRGVTGIRFERTPLVSSAVSQQCESKHPETGERCIGDIGHGGDMHCGDWHQDRSVATLHKWPIASDVRGAGSEGTTDDLSSTSNPSGSGTPLADAAAPSSDGEGDEKREWCGKPATVMDNEGVWMCQACMDETIKGNTPSSDGWETAVEFAIAYDRNKRVSAWSTSDLVASRDAQWIAALTDGRLSERAFSKENSLAMDDSPVWARGAREAFAFVRNRIKP